MTEDQNAAQPDDEVAPGQTGIRTSAPEEQILEQPNDAKTPGPRPLRREHILVPILFAFFVGTFPLTALPAHTKVSWIQYDYDAEFLLKSKPSQYRDMFLSQFDLSERLLPTDGNVRIALGLGHKIVFVTLGGWALVQLGAALRAIKEQARPRWDRWKSKILRR